MQLGKVAQTVCRDTHILPAVTSIQVGDVFYLAGFLLAIIMWGFGLVWLFFALATITSSPRFPFNMGWWGFTFPLGVFTVCTTTLGKEIPSAFFRILGTAFSVVVALLWVMVSVGTLQRIWTGEILVAPCLKEVEKQEAQLARESEKKGNSLEV